jgi:hypothetical protein
VFKRLFGDFLDFVVLFSHNPDAKSRIPVKLNVRKMLIISFGSKSRETETSLWKLTIYFDGSDASSNTLHSPFSDWDIVVCDTKGFLDTMYWHRKGMRALIWQILRLATLPVGCRSEPLRSAWPEFCFMSRSPCSQIWMDSAVSMKSTIVVISIGPLNFEVRR